MNPRNYGAHRHHRSYWAFAVHRVSGLGLALFLPAHFWVLGMAVSPGEFDRFLSWTDMPLVKIAETVLVALLVAHLTGGLRLLALELLPWSPRQKDWIALGGGASVAAALLFLLAAA
jgi:fumarate reductase subunit D